MVKINYKDTENQFSEPLSGLEICNQIDKQLADKAIVVCVNGEIRDLSRLIESDSEVEFLTWESPEGKETFWHSAAHMLAEAVQFFYPEAKFGIGPAIDNGFYYDIDFGRNMSFSEDEFKKIEDKMLELSKQKLPFIRKEVRKKDALALFSSKNENYKIELINDLEENQPITLYSQGNFVDLCRGAHLPHTGFVKAVKILKVSGAYWRGDENNKQLTRIYATAFPDKQLLKDYLQLLEEAEKRNHKKIGKELELFTSSELVGKGFPLLLPKGATLRRVLERFVVDEEIKRGYQHVYTPSMARKKIYEISGHWDLYKDGMYPPIIVGGEEMVLRPMSCPHHFMIYADKPHSYRDLPVRIAELASQYRKEQSGEVSGLIRVMTFTLADSHIFCRPDQVAAEFKGAVELIDYAMKCLGIDSQISYRASLRDDAKSKYVDNPEMWEKNEKFLISILDEIGLEYTKATGHAAFYGPKLDIQMKNVYGKEETVFTVQIDFALPERFDLTYVDENGNKQRPLVVHRSSIGSIERTMSYLIEYYAGAFPLWLAPIQVRLLNITDSQLDYTKNVMSTLQQNLIRVEADTRNETVGKKIREGRLQKIPYLVIIGEKEMETNTITVRNRNTGNQATISIDTFIERILKEQNTFALDLNADVD